MIVIKSRTFYSCSHTLRTESTDAKKNAKSEEYTPSHSTIKQSTSRQNSRNDAEDGTSLQTCGMKSNATGEGSSRQPTRFSTRIVKRPKRDLSPPESPVKKGIPVYDS